MLLEGQAAGLGGKAAPLGDALLIAYLTVIGGLAVVGDLRLLLQRRQADPPLALVGLASDALADDLRLALALRLAIHELVRTKTSLRPTLLLDDVFSELDPVRSKALVAELPVGQSLLTTAAPLPGGIDVATVVQVGDLVR